jgi:hypothetical protein
MQNENPTTWEVLLQPLPALKKVEKKNLREKHPNSLNEDTDPSY